MEQVLKLNNNFFKIVLLKIVKRVMVSKWKKKRFCLECNCPHIGWKHGYYCKGCGNETIYCEVYRRHGILWFRKYESKNGFNE